MTTLQLEALNALLKNSVDSSDYLVNVIETEDLEYINDFDSLYSYLLDVCFFETEYIYYHSAATYLLENDPSFNESMSIAEEFGYSVDNINSCLLATLLATRKNEEDFCDLKDEIEDILFS